MAGIYHRSGAINLSDADGDGRKGIYARNGSWRANAGDTSKKGVYDATGALRVTDVTGLTGYFGAYADDGSWNINIVDGLTRVHTRHANGALNVIDVTGTLGGGGGAAEGTPIGLLMALTREI